MITKPCVYISGPMTGHDDWNFPAFNRAADHLRGLGFPVVNPADFGAHPSDTWVACLKRDLVALVECDTVVLLDGWDRSKGARLEAHIANELGMTVLLAKEIGVPQ